MISALPGLMVDYLAPLQAGAQAAKGSRLGVEPLPPTLGSDALSISHAGGVQAGAPVATRQQAVPGVTMTLLTQNCWGLPSPAGTDLRQRFARMGPAFKGYDFVGLQETFTGEAGRLLKDAGYPYGYWDRKSGGLLKLNSGLMTLTQYPIVGTRFHAYRQANDFDFLARKGILLTRVNVPGVGPVDIYDTHVQAQEYDQIRQTQVAEIVRFIRENDAGYPTILLGDFNAEDNALSQQELRAALGVRDTFREAHPEDPGKTNDGQRIDYIFVLPGARMQVDVVGSQLVNVGPDGKPTLSDHAGLATTLRFRPVTRATRAETA